jgi:hypothetical protein
MATLGIALEIGPSEGSPKVAYEPRSGCPPAKRTGCRGADVPEVSEGGFPELIWCSLARLQETDVRNIRLESLLRH